MKLINSILENPFKATTLMIFIVLLSGIAQNFIKLSYENPYYNNRDNDKTVIVSKTFNTSTLKEEDITQFMDQEIQKADNNNQKLIDVTTIPTKENTILVLTFD